jgi:hypothetical protein
MVGLFSKSAEERLLAAAEDSDFAGVCEALKKGADPQASTPSSWTPLHYAAAKGREDITRVLLNAGAKPEVTTDVGRRPLHWAARNGHSEVCRYLLNAGAKIDAASSPDDCLCTPLHLAAQLGKVTTVRLLLECGASVLRVHAGGSTPLHDVARGGHVHCAALLLAKRGVAIVDLQDEQGLTPLHVAVAAGELGMVRLLVQHGANLELKSIGGRTPADCAKDAATLWVLTDTQAGAAAAPEYGAELPVMTQSPSLTGLTALADLTGAVTPSPKASSAVLPVELSAWLDKLNLSVYAEPLGLSSVEDAAAMDESDLKEVGMKPAERKRWLASKQELLEDAIK